MEVRFEHAKNLLPILHFCGHFIGPGPGCRDKRLDLDVVLLDVPHTRLHEQLQILWLYEDQLRHMPDNLRDEPGRGVADS